MNTNFEKFWYFITFNLLFGLSSCGQTKKDLDKIDYLQSIKVFTVKGNFSTQSDSVFDSIRINSFVKDFPKLKSYESELMNFYRKRNFSYAWFENGQLIEQAGNLTNSILNLEDEGVFKKLAYATTLDSLVHGAGIGSKPAQPNVNLELLLTGEYFVFSSLAWNGMSSSFSKANNWYLPRKKIDYNLYLDSLIHAPIQNLLIKAPVYRQYELLKAYLKKYRILDSQADWTLINGNKKTINSKDSALVTSQVKKRLFQLEDYRNKLLDTLFDNELRLALCRFQQRHGLDTSGMINGLTLAALNVPLKSRIRQILVNMERSRWLPISAQGDYLAVNIPEFKLHVYHDETLLWSCDAVVGQTIHPTTLFYGEINQIVFSPYWNVPESIVAKEILPGMRKNPDYLAKHQMETTGRRNGLPVIRQKPGPANALGLVKFLFPNSYNIYLHDTPSKSLFKETDRAFSHGCIRIAEPAKLAAFLLQDNEKWTQESINTAMHRGKESNVILGAKVPVFITYFTAFIDRDHQLNFRKDLYELDERLVSMLISGDGKY